MLPPLPLDPKFLGVSKVAMESAMRWATSASLTVELIGSGLVSGLPRLLLLRRMILNIKAYVSCYFEIYLNIIIRKVKYIKKTKECTTVLFKQEYYLFYTKDVAVYYYRLHYYFLPQTQKSLSLAS